MQDTNAQRAHLRREQTEYTIVMPLVDAGLALVAFLLAYIVRYEWQILRPVFELNRSSFDPYLPYVAVFIVWLYVNYRGSGLYRPVRGRPWLEEVYSIINGVSNATVVMMAISFVTQPIVFSRLMLIYAAVITIVFLALARVIQRSIQARLRAKGKGVQRVLVIGSGMAEAQSVGGAVLRTMVARRQQYRARARIGRSGSARKCAARLLHRHGDDHAFLVTSCAHPSDHPDLPESGSRGERCAGCFPTESAAGAGREPGWTAAAARQRSYRLQRHESAAQTRHRPEPDRAVCTGLGAAVRAGCAGDSAGGIRISLLSSQARWRVWARI
jgi:hypothetical protein